MVDEFVTSLTLEKVDESTVTNMYSADNIVNKLRTYNVERYLNYFVSNVPPLILIGEAPGYRGCCVSGIPFTSTSVVKNSEFFNRIGASESNNELQVESTASIIWNYLDSIKRYPLFWNAYPFHPHVKNDAKTNRRPDKPELEVGKTYLLRLISIYPNIPIVAVGRVAEEALSSIGFKAPYIRHPSHGGKDDFIEGLSSYL